MAQGRQDRATKYTKFSKKSKKSIKPQKPFLVGVPGANFAHPNEMSGVVALSRLDPPFSLQTTTSIPCRGEWHSPMHHLDQPFSLAEPRHHSQRTLGCAKTASSRRKSPSLTTTTYIPLCAAFLVARNDEKTSHDLANHFSTYFAGYMTYYLGHL